MPSIIISSAPVMASAVALPPEGRTSVSALPWMTRVGAVIPRTSRVRSPDLSTAAIWRPVPAGLRARSNARPARSRTSVSSAGKPGEPMARHNCTLCSRYASRSRGAGRSRKR